MRNDVAGVPCPGEPALVREIEQAMLAASGRHPGIIAEAVVTRILAAYDLLPRQLHHRERRKNHEERIRRFSHEAYRILDDAVGFDPAREIASRLTKAFVLARKADAGRCRRGDQDLRD